MDKELKIATEHVITNIKSMCKSASSGKDSGSDLTLNNNSSKTICVALIS